jgi:phage tail sheath protein FI
MPVHPTYPGLYIEEVPSGVRTITGVSTSATAFVGYTPRGPLNAATQIFSFADYERSFGGLHRDSVLGYSVFQYFQNGGGEAWIVRTAAGSTRASVRLLDEAAAVEVLEASAASEGAWGNALRLEVDYQAVNPASLFNLTVSEVGEENGVLRVLSSERFVNLSMNGQAPGYAVTVVNSGSSLVRLERLADPAALGTGTSVSGPLDPSALVAALDADHRRVAVTVDGEGPYEFDLLDAGESVDAADPLAFIAGRIQDRALAAGAPAFTCGPNADGDALEAASTHAGERSEVRFTDASLRNAARILKLGTGNGGRERSAAAAIRPAQTGTVGGDVLPAATEVTSPDLTVNVALGATTVSHSFTSLWGPTLPASHEELRTRLEAALRGVTNVPALAGATVSLVDGRLRVVAGGAEPSAQLAFEGEAADQLNLLASEDARENVARYAPGIGADAGSQAGAQPGADGSAPGSADLRGTRSGRRGLYALENVDLFNLLCIPETARLEEADALTVLAEALAYCEERRAFLIVDVPEGVRTIDQARGWLGTNASLRSRNAAAYFPQLRLNDPLQNGRLKNQPPSGALAGLYARTDSQRGVWKAPAGTDAVFRGVAGLMVTLTDPENGALNPLGLNCLRSFPVYGTTAWGARTLRGADVLADEYKYVPVRRLALYIEESLYRGLKWVVFEPNDEPLWSDIRLNVGAFMNTLFRQGAFAGRSPREAYLVKCDRETTIQNDVDRGVVNIIVGFAPLKPAEFVILKIQQLAGQIAT